MNTISTDDQQTVVEANIRAALAAWLVGHDAANGREAVNERGYVVTVDMDTDTASRSRKIIRQCMRESARLEARAADEAAYIVRETERLDERPWTSGESFDLKWLLVMMLELCLAQWNVPMVEARYWTVLPMPE